MYDTCGGAIESVANGAQKLLGVDSLAQTRQVQTRQSVAVQREGGIPVGKKILHPYQNP